jgi:hypothetical protein
MWRNAEFWFIGPCLLFMHCSYLSKHFLSCAIKSFKIDKMCLIAYPLRTSFKLCGTQLAAGLCILSSLIKFGAL